MISHLLRRTHLYLALALVIQRQDLVRPRRITCTPADNRVLAEGLPFAGAAFLERFHRRRGYQQGYLADDAWAFSVDAVIVALHVRVLSGLWLWWERKPARWLGALSLAGGAALFVLPGGAVRRCVWPSTTFSAAPTSTPGSSWHPGSCSMRSAASPSVQEINSWHGDLIQDDHSA